MVGGFKKFAAASRGIALSKAIPESIDFEMPCGALCRTDTPDDFLRAQSTLVDALASWAKSKSPSDKLANVSAAELVVVFEVFAMQPGAAASSSDNPLPAIRYAALGMGTGKWYRHAARIMLSTLSAAPTNNAQQFPNYQGVELEHDLDAYVTPLSTPPHPFHCAARGQAKIYNDDQFTAELLTSDGVTFAAKRIKCHSLRYNIMEGGMYRLKVEAIDQVDAIVVDIGPEFNHPPAKIKKKPVPPPAPDDDNFDLLEDMTRDIKRTRTEEKRTMEKKRAGRRCQYCRRLEGAMRRQCLR